MPDEPSKLERIFMAAEDRYIEQTPIIIEVTGPDGWDLIDDMHAAEGYLVRLENGTKYALLPAIDGEVHLGLIPYLLVAIQQLMLYEGYHEYPLFRERFEQAAYAMTHHHLSSQESPIPQNPELGAATLLQRASGANDLVTQLENLANMCCHLLEADALLFTYFTHDMQGKLVADLRKVRRVPRLTTVVLSPFALFGMEHHIPTVGVH